MDIEAEKKLEKAKRHIKILSTIKEQGFINMFKLCRDDDSYDLKPVKITIKDDGRILENGEENTDDLYGILNFTDVYFFDIEEAREERKQAAADRLGCLEQQVINWEEDIRDFQKTINKLRRILKK